MNGFVPSDGGESRLFRCIKKKLLAVLAILVLLGCVFVYQLSYSASQQVKVIGAISQNDLSNIKSLVRHRMVSSRLGASWPKKVWKLKDAIKYYALHPIVEVEVKDPDTVEVLFRQTELRGDVGYMLKKGTNGWEIKATLFQ